jgi:tryptophan halogenase
VEEEKLKNKKLTILGGGTAGWLTALYLKKIFPKYNVILIESKKIGIIGVGEATTPNIVYFLQYLNIDILNLLKETKGAIKNGINFENWNGDNKKYFHGFFENLVNFSLPPIFESNCFSYYLNNLINKKLDFNKYTYNAKISYEYKIDLKNICYALHFDTNLLSDYLEKIAISRGVKYVNGEFKNVSVDKNNNITKISLKNNLIFDCDFIFDCSGFNRLLIGKHYKIKWKSYKKHLPMKKAIPFWLENDKKIEPYTTALAMKYGWVWKIPLQHRIGSGYIFDSNYINEEQALNEVEKKLNKKIKVNKIINFEAGRFEKFWHKNCISLGLASSFIEPLESTSIFLTIQQLLNLNHFINDLFNQNEKSISLFNEMVNKNMDETLNFVYLHYITKRKDSLFWKNFKKDYLPPPEFKDKLDLLKENNLKFFDIDEVKKTAFFPLSSYLMVANGLDLFTKKININYYENITPNINQYLNLINDKSKEAIDHSEFLNKL